LNGSILDDAVLIGATIQSATLDLASLQRVVLGGTLFSDVDLSKVQGLESCSHTYPSTMGVDTLLRSQGRVPGVFLRGAGVPDSLIEYLGSLTGIALEFHTVFISFTEADDLFSQGLYNDLHAAGVRCWRWKEDAKWGRALSSATSLLKLAVERARGGRAPKHDHHERSDQPPADVPVAIRSVEVLAPPER
jgi:hypothetical protein